MDQPLTRTTSPTVQVRIDHSSAVHVAASAARALAERCALPGALPHKAAVLASELATNIDKHAKDGTLYLRRLPLGGGLEITAVDRGPGIPDVAAAFTDGYTTTATLGSGLGAIRRMATDFTLRTESGTGTLACARLSPPEQAAAARQELGAVCLPAEAEEHCGDACAAADTGDSRTVIVVDGLGHGPQAAEAAQCALRAFHRVPESTLPDILTTVHRSLRHTRGAAAGVLRLRAGQAEYAGIGNVRALVLTRTEARHRLTGQPGVLGLTMPAPRVHRIPLTPDSTAVLHSDGICPRWAHLPSPFLLRLPPSLLAAAVAHGHRRTRDDATVLTVRPRHVPPTPQTPRSRP
ncbi:SpoIIE family protein phosphatase [Streptomyces sp. 549]|uniref:SpoIIE family protein phosphatase n=1 Tax=Streptomyces sp. 549 TaxID=3049076 RepID=UPI0024C44403|nr:SpoIIE family protein phosphatase [Streptomyces sp. 549]MDK1471966.1 SpoIIE family protein phosphatase [Streptomyces sp. 549]